MSSITNTGVVLTPTGVVQTPAAVCPPQPLLPGHSNQSPNLMRGPPNVSRLNHSLDPDLAAAFRAMQHRALKYERTGVPDLSDPRDLRRADWLSEQAIAHSETIGASLDVAKEWLFRLNASGSLALNGEISFLSGGGKLSMEAVYHANFSKLDQYIHNPSVTPTALWEVDRVWSWPSDHLPAVSEVTLLGESSIKVGTMNLLKEGFDDNRLQTSQGLGGQLSSRYLERKSESVISPPALMPSQSIGAETAPRAPRPQILWQESENEGKAWDLPTMRRQAQNRYIVQQIRAGKIDLLGLNEVSTKHAVELKKIAQANGFEVIVTPSARPFRDLVDGSINPDLQDNSVIMINSAKVEVLRDRGPVVSHYVDSRGRPNKHITTLILKSKDTGREFAFTNTHADFGGIRTLAEHNAQLDVESNIVVGDMNHSPEGVISALSAFAPEGAVQYSNNLPAHVGFAEGREGEVVAYDQVFLVGEGSVTETKDIHQWHVDYALAYQQEFEQALIAQRLQM